MSSNEFQERALADLLAPSEIVRARGLYRAYYETYPGDLKSTFESLLVAAFPRLSRGDAYAVEYHLMREKNKPVRRGKPDKPENWRG